MNLIEASATFYGKCIAKLLKRQAEGFHGWDEKRYHSIIRKKLNKNVQEHDWVDVANLAMMLHFLESEEMDGKK